MTTSTPKLKRKGSLPPFPTESGSASETVKHLRFRILNGIFLGAGGIAVLTYLISIPVLLRQQSWVAVSVYSIAVVLLMVLIFGRKIPYNFRAWGLLFLFYVIALTSLLNDGLYANGRMYLITLPILAGLLLGFRSGGVVMVIATATVIVIGTGMSAGFIPAPPVRPNSGNDNPGSWILACAVFILMGAVMQIPFTFYFRELEGLLDSEKDLSHELEVAHHLAQEQVVQRTAALERRLGQLHTAAEIASSLGTLHETRPLLNEVANRIRERFDLYYVGVFLLEPEVRPGAPRLALLAAGTGSAGEKMLAAGHKLLMGGESMVGWTTAHGKARIALDVGQEAVRFNNPHLPETRSELALPILSGGKVLGALTIQSVQVSAFDQDDIIVLQGLADTLGVALANAQLFSELQANLAEIQSLHQRQVASQWAGQRRLEYTYTRSAAQPGDAAQPGGDHVVEFPLRLRGHTLGILRLAAEPPAPGSPQEGQAPFSSPEQKTLIEAVATQAALALENARLLEDTRSTAARQALLAEAATRMRETLDLDLVLQTAAAEIAAALDLPEVTIRLAPEHTQEIPAYPGAAELLPAGGNGRTASDHRDGKRSGRSGNGHNGNGGKAHADTGANGRQAYSNPGEPS